MSTQWLEALGKTIERTTAGIPTAASSLIMSVGDYAFKDCSALTSISLPACTSVGERAFCFCTKLTSINLPACTSVGDSAFAYCSRLTSINLPACTSVDYNAFYSCSKLTSIHFAASNQTAIEASSYYASKFGASNATIYFDL